MSGQLPELRLRYSHLGTAAPLCDSEGRIITHEKSWPLSKSKQRESGAEIQANRELHQKAQRHIHLIHFGSSVREYGDGNRLMRLLWRIRGDHRLPRWLARITRRNTLFVGGYFQFGLTISLCTRWKIVYAPTFIQSWSRLTGEHPIRIAERWTAEGREISSAVSGVAVSASEETEGSVAGAVGNDG